MSVHNLVLRCREQGSARLAAPDHGGLQGVGLSVKARPDQLVRMVIARADSPREYLRWDADQDISRPRPGESPMAAQASAMTPVSGGCGFREEGQTGEDGGARFRYSNCAFANWPRCPAGPRAPRGPRMGRPRTWPDLAQHRQPGKPEPAARYTPERGPVPFPRPEGSLGRREAGGGGKPGASGSLARVLSEGPAPAT
jgi:hypothetical protein